MAGLQINELKRSNMLLAWNFFTLKTSHSLSDVLKPGYFNVARLRLRDDDFINVLVKNDAEYLMVELMATDIKADKLVMSVISKKDLSFGRSAGVVSREMEILKPGV